MKKLLFTLLILTCAAPSFAQPKTPDQLARALSRASVQEKFDAANDLFYQKKYYHALQVFLNLAQEAPDNHHFNYKVGVCYLKSNTERTKALPFLEKAKEGITKNFDPYSYQHKKSPMETYFYLGQAYHLDYQFDKSIEQFNIFKDKASKKHRLLHSANLQIVQCNLGKQMVADPRTDVEISNLGPTINSEYSDFSPVISLDGNVLYFTSRRMRKDSSNMDEFNWENGKHYEDIYVSYKDRNGNWQEPKVIGFSEIDRNEATIGVSADGMELLAYIDDDGDGNIYYSAYQDTNFNDLEKLGEGTTDINTKYWEPHATVSPDGNTMYFVSDRKGGLGGRDIYVSKKLPNGDWGLAQNLGAPINTEDDEDSPFIAADGITLYYSSNGEKSMGGFDIFVTRKKEDGTWVDPKNMRYPINTVDDDVFFIMSADGVTGYFSSLHEAKQEDANHGKDEGYGEKDIYTIKFKTLQTEPVAVLKGFIIPKPGEPIPSNIEIYANDKTTGERLGPFVPRKDDGGYVMSLEPCHEYYVEYFMDGELFSETEFKVPCEADIHTLHNEIFLDPTMTEPAGLPASAVVRWKVIDAPMSLVGNNVNYYDENGEIMGSVSIDDNNVFSYPNKDHDYTYRFELDQNEIICKATCIALIDSNDNVLGYSVRGEDCKFFYENLDQKWQLVDKDGNPYKSNSTKVLFKDSDGNLSFEEKLGCNGMFAYHPLSPDGSQMFELDGVDVDLCDEAKIVLLDKDNNIIGETERDEKCRFTYGEKKVVTPCNVSEGSYQKFYKYNMRDIKLDEKDFQAFVNNAVELIKCHGHVKIEIEASASKVPTSTYGSNTKLTQKRANDAKKRLLEALKKQGYTQSQVKFTAFNALVQGPRYKNDFKENMAEYEKYQYVKLKAK